MWAIDNRTAYAAERTWVRSVSGAHEWIVAVKATFTVAPDGKLELAEKQLPPLRVPEFTGEPGKSSLRYEADLTPLKPATDVTVNAQAHAPKGNPVEDLPVSVSVGGKRKVLLVRGMNVFYEGALGLTTTAPRPFVKMPIVYERAWGGADLDDPQPAKQKMEARNPVGVGVARKPASLEATPGPNIVYPGKDLDFAPAGFGAIASTWSPRRELAGTYDERWEKSRKPLLPADWDQRSLLCAPEDQQTAGYLRPGTPIELVHMTPEGVLRFELPRIALSFVTAFGRTRQEHEGHLVSVVVEPEDRRLILVWQTSLMVPARQLDYLDATRIDEKEWLR
jgi:hypothetical protein